MKRDIFIFGLSGAGKDTISNYLRDNYDYLKIRIAGTIKQFVFETYGFKTQEEFENAKRERPEVRKAHNIFGNQYDNAGIELSGSEASKNRILDLISRNALEFEISKDLNKKSLCIVDVRTKNEAEICLNNGMFGIFLTRRSSEYADKKHKTEQDMYNGISGHTDSDFANLAKKYKNQVILVRNHNNAKSDVNYTKFGVNVPIITTDGTDKDLIMSITDILFM